MTTDVMKMPSLAPGADLDAYLRTISQFPILTPEDEQSLAHRLRNNEDLDAARELVMCHLRFVVHLARSYKGYGLSQADLIQEGNVGLMKAVKRFDPNVGVRLISFAVHWIKAEMHEYILRNWRIVKVATTKVQKKLFFNLRKMTTSLDQLSEQTIQDVAEELQVPTADVREMALRMRGIDASFDATSDEDFSAPERSLVLEGADPAEVVETLDAQVHESARLASAFAVLDARSQEIIQRRWMSEAKASLAELAEDFGVSIERVRQIEQAALKKLRSLVTTD